MDAAEGYIASRAPLSVSVINSKTVEPVLLRLRPKTIQRPVLTPKSFVPLLANRRQLRKATVWHSSNVCVVVYCPGRRGK